VLIVTTHGYPALATIKGSKIHQDMFRLNRSDAAKLIERLQRDRFVFLPYDATTLKLANVGEVYGNAFMDVEQANSWWSEAFDLVDHVPGGLGRDWQDAVVLRKK
jgi:hypothetical protein